MGTLERLGPAELRNLMPTFRDALRAHQQVLNSLNVYPVPDGDTGTNMALTLESVVTELEGAATDLDATCKAISHGSLMGARGNSGVILSQILRGVAEVIRTDADAGATSWSKALQQASDAAYGAVMRPVEGTILTVARESAEAAARAADEGAPLVGVLEAARAAGGDALERTPELLPALAEAGVVDAGGAGYLLLLDSLLTVVDGRPLPEPPAAADVVSLDEHLVHAHEHAGDPVSDLRYEVMYFLEAPDDTIPAFKDVWAGIGDSIVVVGGDGIWNCHIHTDDIGGAIEAAIECGRPRDIRVTDLLEQVEEERWVREAALEDGAIPDEREQVPTAVVAVCTGDGVQRIFHSLGVQEIVTGGQTMNPSTADLLAAVERAPSQAVVVLPNNKNIVPVAEQVDDATGKTVTVVPTVGIAEGFAALMAYDPHTPIDENADAMSAAASNVIAAEVCPAVRDSQCELGPIKEGEYLGMTRSGIASINGDLAEAAIRLLDQLVTDDHEIVTLIEGEGSTAAVTRRITEWLNDHRPGTSPEVHHGGQPLYPYLFGIE